MRGGPPTRGTDPCEHIRYCRAHGWEGTLWRGRYKSLLVCESFAAFKALSLYIALNPVRAGIAKRGTDSKWTSYGQARRGGGFGAECHGALLRELARLAGARDERFAAVVPNQTGGGGAPLAKRYFGEPVATETVAFPHWFCPAYRKYADNEAALPFDQHWLLACVAPRALLVEGFNMPWFDPLNIKGQTAQIPEDSCACGDWLMRSAKADAIPNSSECRQNGEGAFS